MTQLAVDARMLEQIRGTVDAHRDTVRVFSLFGAREAKTIAVGDARMPVDTKFYIA